MTKNDDEMNSFRVDKGLATSLISIGVGLIVAGQAWQIKELIDLKAKVAVLNYRIYEINSADSSVAVPDSVPTSKGGFHADAKRPRGYNPGGSSVSD